MATSTAVGTAPTANHASPDLRALLILLIGIVVISFNGIFVALANTNGDVAGAYRLGIGVLLLTIPALLNRRPSATRWSPSAVGLGIAAGIASAVDLGSWNTAVLIIGPGMATLLGNTAPLWVALGAWLLFREKLRPLYWVGLAVAVTGAILIVGLDLSQGLNTGLGNLLGLGTGIAYASYQLITHRARALIDTLTYMWIYSIVGALALLAVALLLRHPLLGLPPQTYAALGALGVVSIGGWILVNYSFGHLPVSLVTVTLIGQPVITTVLQMIVFGQVPKIWQIGGGLVVLAGIYVVHRSRSAEREQADV